MARPARLVATLLAALAATATTGVAHAASLEDPATASQAKTWSADAKPKAVPRARCRRGSNPEPGIQGRVPPGKRSAAGLRCNTKLVSQAGQAGGFKVFRYVDRAGRECAYYDTTLLFPSNARTLSDQPTGVHVLDMSNPAKPVRTAALQTPAMQTPHESVSLNKRRGLLAAVMGNAFQYPGVVDVYDLKDDCRHPKLQSSLPVGLLGHEGAFAPDGNTYYATSLWTGHVTPVDLRNPKLPRTLGTFTYRSHGLSISNNGNRAYLAAREGLVTLDVSEVQARKPFPRVREVSRLSWPTQSIPQTTIPVTIGGRPFVIEMDEYATPIRGGARPTADGQFVGVARIIDISNEKAPRVVSNIRLAVHEPANREGLTGDPGADSGLQGYSGHYCSVPKRTEPGIVACTMIASGLRLFDIRDPYRPKEIAYFTTPLSRSSTAGTPSNYAMSSVAFVPQRRELWYSDGNTGFYALRTFKGVWPFGSKRTRPKPRRRRCVDRRKFRFRVRRGRGARVVKVVVYVNGRRRLVRRGRDIRRITIRRLPRKRFVVKIVTTRANGVKSISRRVYRGCRKSRPRTVGRHPRR